MSVHARLGILLFVVPSIVGCTRCSDTDKKGGQPDAAASASALPAAGGAPGTAGAAGAATTDAAAGQSGILAREIPAGPAPNGTWTIKFNLEHIAGDENLTWSEALAHCHEKGKELCLETQWQRACELDSSLGQFESWTLTADFPGAAVRGGADGCKTRSFRKIDEKSPTRIGLCCDRAIAVSSDDKSDEFRAAATKRVLDFEAALGTATAETLGKEFADKLSLEGNELDRAAALTKLAEERKDDAERVAFYDHCSIKLSEDNPPLLLADCGVILRSQGKTRGFAQRIAFAGPNGPVTYLGDPKAMKQKEQKERVKTFLPSE